jgi:tRNA-uridine 2-sulfurtransferase
MMRVFVGMSGGVDSSVAAKRLLDRGYDVVGVFIKVWQPDFIHCDWERERLDAMRVAAHLGIPFLTMNAEDVYKREVADYMIRSYEAGITPNPDVMCNEHVKFGAFYEWAKANGADKIATGHYAQAKSVSDIMHLYRAVDPSKDQSYFLWRIKQHVLEDVLFPIGDTLKSDIRAEALRAHIPTATKSDSQGICFLGQIDMYTFLSQYIDLKEGAVLNEDGVTIGTHRGALLYTQGQRHGFTVSAQGSQMPHYVVSRDRERNTITVSTNPYAHEARTSIHLSEINMLGSGLSSSVLHGVPRYHAVPVLVTVESRENGSAILSRATGDMHEWVTGQSCVLYREDECVGGGVIS